MKTFTQFLNEAENDIDIKWVSFDDLCKLFSNSPRKKEFYTDKLKATFPKLVDSKSDFKECKYCVAMRGKDFLGGIAIGPRKDEEYNINKELPFVYELGSIEKGIGSKLVKLAMEKFGTKIWFGVQDVGKDSADEWWNGKAKKWNFTIKKIGETHWNTPMYIFYK